MYATARLRLVGGSSVARWWLGGGSAAVGSTARRRLQLLRATHHYAAQRQQRRWRRRRRSDGDTKTAISTRTSAMMPREHLPPRDPPTRVMSQCAADARQPDEQHGADVRDETQISRIPLGTCVTVARTGESGRAAVEEAQAPYLIVSKRQSGARRQDVLLRTRLPRTQSSHMLRRRRHVCAQAGTRSTWPTRARA
jgi:hypothetical protein